MPVDVWGNVAQAGEVDLVRIDETTQNRFDMVAQGKADME